MEIFINGEKRLFNEQSVTIQELLARCDAASPDAVSVQLNDKFVPRDGFDLTRVRNGDRIDFLFFVGGGWNSKSD
jgi:thiamine biosynthesis protein ThiS